MLSPLTEAGRGPSEAILHLERARLVQLCARLTGAREAAEDLAQETLIVAWRQKHALRDPALRDHWLAGIARNLSLHWLRKQGRESMRLVRPNAGVEATNLMDQLAGDVDLEVELERAELAHLLDRAMAFLPSLTRSVLVARFVEETPQAEIARRLGLTEGAVEARIQRGKRTLRKVLTTDLEAEGSAYGLVKALDDVWQEARIWCPMCGGRQLEGRFSDGHRRLVLRCPSCLPGPLYTMASDIRDDFVGVHSYRVAFSRLIAALVGDVYARVEAWTMPCGACRRRVPVRLGEYAACPAVLVGRSRIAGSCPACGWDTDTVLAGGIALSLPEGRRFRRDHPRIATLPERRIDVAGGPAAVAGFRDVTGSATFEAVISLDTLKVLRVYGGPGA